ncbi:16656_t:CDS:2 [Dentiscutata heterogama]|uniref:16656_t:CDS:1 n=1 Tax=Dentiscutata heterogama TaxID=1316150 RepID=A0ACA9K1Y2_9GLOM|nr:16656_t:CDS:2 [Dentiscutata heterogama]
MGSSTASPETSPARADKARKPGSEIYVPKQRRGSTGEELSPVGDFANNNINDTSENQDNGVIRKGRGKFRGPGSDTQQDQQNSRAPRGRDFDATVLRQYPPKGGEKPSKGHAKKKSKSDSRRNSNGQQGSESGGSGSENNASDDITKITNSLENVNIGDNENDNNPTIQINDTSTIPQEGQQNVEEWEKNVANGEVKTKDDVSSPVASPVDGASNPFDWSTRQKEGQRTDNHAYEGSTRILDIFDFPPSFKTHHLHEIFQEYETMRGGYRIKWMEDTRALIIFEHPATARKAYLDNVTNQLATIKPYDGPTDFLQKNPNNSAQRIRPVTTDMVAKRLVHGALGVRVPRSPEQRQVENQILRTARDQRDQKRNEQTKRSQDLDAAFDE